MSRWGCLLASEHALVWRERERERERAGGGGRGGEWRGGVYGVGGVAL